MKKLITNATYLTKDYTWQTGNILIEDGKIAKLSCDLVSVDETIDAKGQIVIPGLINAHSHSYTSFLKGTIDNVPLDIYMLHAFAGNTVRNPREIYVSTQLEGLQLLKFGVTSTFDHFMMRPKATLEGMESAASAYLDCGIKANIAPQYSDLPFTDTVPFEQDELPKEFHSLPSSMSHEEYFELMKNAMEKYNGKSNVNFVVGVDGPQRCSDELMHKTADFIKEHDCGWHTHILETKTQAIASYDRYGKGLIEYIDELGLLNKKTSFVHYIWVTDIEKELVRKNQVNIVHCPSSSLHLGSGVAPVDQLVKDGNKVAIGTDGGNSGNLNLLEKIRLTADLHNLAQPDYDLWLSAKQSLQMCYDNGARVMMRDNIGKIEVGFAADLVFIDTMNILWQPVRDLLTQLVYMETGQNIVRVMVDGETVVKDGKSLLIDESALISEAMAMSEKLSATTKDAFVRLEQQHPYFRKMYLREIKKDIGMNRFIRPVE
jgi:cytosine/adenosine deaminase-related metal-dependent hydrolase